MKQHKAACLLFVSAILWTSATDAADVELSFPHQPEAIRLLLDLRVGNERPEAVWDTFLDRWFAFFDRDSNEQLSTVEAGRVPPLPLADGRQVILDRKQFDTNGDCLGSRSEIKAFYRQAGFKPVLTVLQNPPDDSVRVNEALFQHLDRDKNGILTKSELDQAVRLLNRLDEDEDQALTLPELLSSPFQEGIPLPHPNEARATDVFDDAAGHGVLSAELLPASLPTISVKANMPTPLIEVVSRPQASPLRLRIGENYCAVVVNESAKQKGFKSAVSFYLAQFRTTFGKEGEATRQELANDPTLRLIVELFDVIDQDGDGRMTLEELKAFLSLINQGIVSQAVTTLSSQGRSLFEILDIDHDGRLILSELNRASELLVGDQIQSGVTRDKIPIQFRLRLEQAVPGTTFGAEIPIPNSTQRAKEVDRSIHAKRPRWFEFLDKNEDGTVSLLEFPGTAKRFQQLDTDSDGLISGDEAESHSK